MTLDLQCQLYNTYWYVYCQVLFTAELQRQSPGQAAGRKRQPPSEPREGAPPSKRRARQDRALEK